MNPPGARFFPRPGLYETALIEPTMARNSERATPTWRFALLLWQKDIAGYIWNLRAS
jgi:hypothetical protein